VSVVVGSTVPAAVPASHPPPRGYVQTGTERILPTDLAFPTEKGPHDREHISSWFSRVAAMINGPRSGS